MKPYIHRSFDNSWIVDFAQDTFWFDTWGEALEFVIDSYYINLYRQR